MSRHPRNNAPDSRSTQRRADRRRGFGPWPVFLVLGLILLLILREEFPAVDARLEGWFAPERAHARATCLEAAVQAAGRPAYARVLDRGEISATQAGYYVDGISVGEMGPDGAERVYGFSCYLDAAGALAATHKQNLTGSAAAAHPRAARRESEEQPEEE